MDNGYQANAKAPESDGRGSQYIGRKPSGAKNLYTAASDFTVDCEKMMSRGTLFDIRTHTRFIRFPKHRHNYIEIMYMCEGATTHIINDTEKVVPPPLEKGDLLFLHQTCFHEIEAAGGKRYRGEFYCPSRVFSHGI